MSRLIATLKNRSDIAARPLARPLGHPISPEPREAAQRRKARRRKSGENNNRQPRRHCGLLQHRKLNVFLKAVICATGAKRHKMVCLFSLTGIIFISPRELRQTEAPAPLLSLSFYLPIYLPEHKMRLLRRKQVEANTSASANDDRRSGNDKPETKRAMHNALVQKVSRERERENTDV